MKFFNNDVELMKVCAGLLKQCGDGNYATAMAAQRQLAEAAVLPLRQAVLDGDIIGKYGIFEPVVYQPGQNIEWPMDILVPGTEDEYSAYTLPNAGRIAEKHVEGDYLTCPTFDVGASIDFHLKFARDANWNIVGRALEILANMFVRKINSDGWKLIIGAGVDRNVIVFDSLAPNGFLTKRLISLAKTEMKRRGGGNSASLNRFRLTDYFCSIESLEDVRDWDLTQIDDVTRREIFLAEDESITKVFGVFLHEMTELGVGQVYQNYFTSLGGTLNGSDTELGIGLCLDDSNGSSFIMPVRQEVEVFEDESLHRQRRQGYYAWGEHGFLLADNRNVLLTSA